MPNAVDQLVNPFLIDSGFGALLPVAMQQFYLFLLVLVRISGLMIIGPYFGHTSIPQNVRALLALVISCLIFPSLYSDLISRTIPVVPSTIFDLGWVIAAELLIGIFLSFGVMLILMGVQMAGDMFDQQAGTAMGEIFNPLFNGTAAPVGQLMYMMATAVFLVAVPMHGQLQMLSITLQTFTSIPLGQVLQLEGASEVLLLLVQNSVTLSLQLAAPMLAAMSLVSLTLGFLGYTVPQINVLVMGFPIRATLAFFILIMTATGMTSTMLASMNDSLEILRGFLVS